MESHQKLLDDTRSLQGFLDQIFRPELEAVLLTGRNGYALGLMMAELEQRIDAALAFAKELHENPLIPVPPICRPGRAVHISNEAERLHQAEGLLRAVLMDFLTYQRQKQSLSTFAANMNTACASPVGNRVLGYTEGGPATND